MMGRAGTGGVLGTRPARGTGGTDSAESLGFLGLFTRPGAGTGGTGGLASYPSHTRPPVRDGVGLGAGSEKLPVAEVADASGAGESEARC